MLIAAGLLTILIRARGLSFPSTWLEWKPLVVIGALNSAVPYTLNFRGETQQNEQSLAVTVKNLRDGYGRAAFRTTFNDFRSYRRMEMFIHAEGDLLRDNEVSAFIRVGSDNQDNYYEYNLPLKITTPGSRDPNVIWPEQNRLDIDINLFKIAKTARNNAVLNGQPWPINVPAIPVRPMA